jgi:heme a synthase
LTSATIHPGQDSRTTSDVLSPVRIWLWCVAVLVLAMILVGGATRLTGSGLSITEWRPLLGAIPPLSEAAWLAEFDKYRAIPQYQLLNKGMSLTDFKFIYWWEWGHRQLGRFIGVAYMLPLAWFWLRGTVGGKLALWLLALGALGGFQGAIGWIMVASGLKEGMVAVAPVKLALHLTTACLILAGLVWTARRLACHSRPERRGVEGNPEKPSALGQTVALDPLPSPIQTSLRSLHTLAAGSPGMTRRIALTSKAIVVLLLVQIALGALVAGSKSGLTYNTWPLMDGALIPGTDVLFVVKPWIENFVDNPALVQFNHRLTAYLLLALAIWHALDARGTAAARGAVHVAAALSLQAALGVVTLLLHVPLWAGLLHQILAALVLIATVVHAEKAGR